MADKRHLRHHRDAASKFAWMEDERRARFLFPLPRHTNNAFASDLVDAALALGPRFPCLARKPDPRAVAWPRYPALYFDGLRHWLESRRACRRALRTAGAVHRAKLIFVRPLLQFVAHGNRRRQWQFFRAVRRRADRGFAAGMAAYHARLLLDRLCGGGHGDTRFLSNGRARAHRADENVGPTQGHRNASTHQWCRPMTAVLEVSNIRKTFGGIVAVDDVSLKVRAGEILGIIGPNGSGKSTLFNCVLGQLQPSAGEVRIDGKLTTGMRPCDLNRLGVSRTFQLLQVFPQLSVRDNLILAGQDHQDSMGSRLVGRADAGLSDAAGEMIEFFGLSHLVHVRAGSLSYGQQKLLDAAMAFMAGPRLGLLDEPAGGVHLTLPGQLRERLHAYHAERNATFVVIEHQMEFVMALCTRVVALAEGRVIAEGAPQDIRSNPAVIEAYLGH